MSVGIRLKTIKKHFRFKHDEFAEILGVASPTLSKYYRGDYSPTLISLSGLIEHIPNLNANWLVFGKGEMLFNTGASNQIITYDENNSIGQANYNPTEADYNEGVKNNMLENKITKLEERTKKIENEITQLKILLDSKDKTIVTLEGNIGTLNDMISMLKK